MLYYILCILLILSGFVMGHGLANYDNQLISFVTGGTGLAWIHFGVAIFIAYHIRNQSSKESTNAANRILRYNQLLSKGHDVDLVMGSSDELHKLAHNYKLSDSLSISQPQITGLSLERLGKNTSHKSN